MGEMEFSLLLVLLLNICCLTLVRTQAVIETLSLPDGANCGQNIPAYLVTDSYKVLTDDKLFYEDVEEDECKIICSDNKDDKGASVLCTSFNYNVKSRLCSINRGKATPVGKLQLKPAAGSRYYEKICLSDNSPANCGDAPFFRANQAVLVGYAKNTTRAKDLSTCVGHCIGWKGECKSAMYFIDSGDCILNSASAQGAPDVFIEEMDEEKVVYFENGCIMANQIRSQNRVSASPGHKPSKSNSSRAPASKQRRKPSTSTKSMEQEQKLTNSTFSLNASRRIASSKSRQGGGINAEAAKDQDDDQNEIAVTARRASSKSPTDGESGPGADDSNLAEYRPWGSWSRCDRPDGRRVRKRKCPKRKRCRGLDIETQWCPEVDESQLLATNQSAALNDASELDDGAGLGELTTEELTTEEQTTVQTTTDSDDYDELATTKRTRRPKSRHHSHHRRTTVFREPSLTTPAPAAVSEKWSPWSDQCRPFDDPNGCKFGTRLGFQTRQCLRSPFECQGPFFRYCITQC